jgi:hypothetical protein
MTFISAAEPGVLRQVVSVLLVFALLAAALWRLGARQFDMRSLTLRKVLWGAGAMKTARDGGMLLAAGRVALTPQHVLHLIRVDGREILIATHPTGCNVLIESNGPLSATKGAGV